MKQSVFRIMGRAAYTRGGSCARDPRTLKTRWVTVVTVNSSRYNLITGAEKCIALVGDPALTGGLLACLGWPDVVPFADRAGRSGIYVIRRGDLAVVWASHALLALCPHDPLAPITRVFLNIIMFQNVGAVIAFDDAELRAVARSTVRNWPKKLLKLIPAFISPESPSGPYCSAVSAALSFAHTRSRLRKASGDQTNRVEQFSLSNVITGLMLYATITRTMVKLE